MSIILQKEVIMQSSKFGPPMWQTMFFTAVGYDLNETDSQIKNEQYKTFFKSFGTTLPCIYCRDSFTKFFKEVNFDNYVSEPREPWSLVRYVYDLKEKVNSKLKDQEKDCLQNEFEKLTALKDEKLIDKKDFWNQFRDKAHNIVYTKNTPSYETVLNDLLKLRADCKNVNKHCRDPKKPEVTDSTIELNVAKTVVGGRSKRKKITSRRQKKLKKKSNGYRSRRKSRLR